MAKKAAFFDPLLNPLQPSSAVAATEETKSSLSESFASSASISSSTSAVDPLRATCTSIDDEFSKTKSKSTVSHFLVPQHRLSEPESPHATTLPSSSSSTSATSSSSSSSLTSASSSTSKPTAAAYVPGIFSSAADSPDIFPSSDSSTTLGKKKKGLFDYDDEDEADSTSSTSLSSSTSFPKPKTKSLFEDDETDSAAVQAAKLKVQQQKSASTHAEYEEQQKKIEAERKLRIEKLQAQRAEEEAKKKKKLQQEEEETTAATQVQKAVQEAKEDYSGVFIPKGVFDDSAASKATTAPVDDELFSVPDNSALDRFMSSTAASSAATAVSTANKKAAATIDNEPLDDDLFSFASNPSGAGGAVKNVDAQFDFAAYINANSNTSGGLFDK